MISHFKWYIEFWALDSVSKIGPLLSGIVFEFEGSKLNVSRNLLEWIIKQESILPASQLWFTCKKKSLYNNILLYSEIFTGIAASDGFFCLPIKQTNKIKHHTYMSQLSWVYMTSWPKLKHNIVAPFYEKKIYAKLKLEACLDSEKKQIVCCKHVDKGIFKCPLYLLKIKTKNPKGSNPGFVKPFLSIKVLKDVTKYCKQLRNYMLKFTQFQYETKLDLFTFWWKTSNLIPPCVC